MGKVRDKFEVWKANSSFPDKPTDAMMEAIVDALDPKPTHPEDHPVGCAVEHLPKGVPIVWVTEKTWMDYHERIKKLEELVYHYRCATTPHWVDAQQIEKLRKELGL